MRVYALYCGLILYALFGSPTPDILSIYDYAISLCLIIAVGISGVIQIIYLERNGGITLHYHRVFVAFMISVPTIIGAMAGHAPSDIIRDVIPILFLILPFCFLNKRMDMYPFLLSLIGLIFSLRYLSPFIPPLDFMVTDTSLLYLANSPLVPFAAIHGFYIFSDNKPSFLTKRIYGLAITIICFAAMGAMLQRAPFALCAIACIAILSLRLIQNPKHSWIYLVVIVALILPIFPILADISITLGEKTYQVGMNNRIEEFQAVLSQSTILGQGWGGTWQSPAVADIWVRFTHNMVSYYWLKAGALGAILSCLFIIAWGWHIILLMRINVGMGLAIAIPFIIHVTLYSGFKTLDFALLLTLAMVTWRSVNPSLSSTAPFPPRWARREG